MVDMDVVRLSSREKKKNRNSPSRKTVGDNGAPEVPFRIAPLPIIGCPQ
jgi:hypothetical protein